MHFDDVGWGLSQDSRELMLINIKEKGLHAQLVISPTFIPGRSGSEIYRFRTAIGL